MPVKEKVLIGKTACQPRASKGTFAHKPQSIKLTVTTRQQTAQEGRQFSAALGSLLSELVRKELDRGRKQS
jgi:hypothetical protein